MGRPKKAPTTQIRVAVEVAEQAFRVGAMKGSRQVGDFVTDLLRPLLAEMERELLAQRARDLGAPPPAPASAPGTKRPKAKGE